MTTQPSEQPNTTDSPRVRVAIVNDYEVIVRGLAQMLSGDSRIEVVELASQIEPSEPVDIVLFDSFAAEQGAGHDMLRLLSNPNVHRLVVYTWNLDPMLIETAKQAGAAGYLSKTSGRDEIISALLRVHSGERVFDVAQPTAEDEDPEESRSGEWPGREFGLSAREAEVVGLIVQGLTNEQIAKRAYLSINSVKTYIRSAYRKMGVVRRSQAVLWGIQHGFMPRPHAVKPSSLTPPTSQPPR